MRYQHSGRSGPIGGTPRQDRRTNRLTQGRVTMFMLGAFWAWNPPIACFGAQSPCFGQIGCKTPLIVGQSEKCILSHRVVHPKFCNVMQCHVGIPMVRGPWDFINKSKAISCKGREGEMD